MMFIAWVIVYGAVYTCSEKVSMAAGIPHMATVLAMSLYWGVFFWYIHRSGRAKTYHICAPRNKKPREYALYIPLLLMPAVNGAVALGGGYLNRRMEMQKGITTPVFQLFLLLLLTVSSIIGEEVLFRGVLPVAVAREYKTSLLHGVIVSSFAFAGVHMVNAWQGENVYYVCLQVLNAGAVGFCLGVVAVRECSIVPGVLVHFLINISAGGIEGQISTAAGNEVAAFSGWVWVAFLVPPVLYLLYGIFLYQKAKEKSAC